MILFIYNILYDINLCYEVLLYYTITMLYTYFIINIDIVPLYSRKCKDSPIVHVISYG